MLNKKFPSIPDPSRSVEGMFETVRTMKELAEVITGQRKNSSPYVDEADLNTLNTALLTSIAANIASIAANTASIAANTASIAALTPVAGAWTPNLLLGGAAVGMTYTTRVGRSFKLPGKMLVWAHIRLSAKGSSTGQATISGLPTPAVSNVQFYAGAIGFYGGLTSVVNLGCLVPAGSSVINLYNLPAAALTDVPVTNATEIILAAEYEI